MKSEVHVNDIGTAFRATVYDEDSLAVSLTGVSSKYLIFKKPDGTVSQKSADFYTDGSDGVIQYISESGFLDQPALWQLQGYVIFPGGSWKTDIYEFRVFKNLE